MIVPFLDLKKQISSIRHEIDLAVKRVINSASFIQGKEVGIFEKEFSKLIGVPYTVSVGNGTDALFIALKSLGVGRGDEVITAANSFIATAEAITATGAKVVFADVCADSYNINPDDVERKISGKTKVIVPVHLFGQMADMDKVVKIAGNNKIFVVEDAAQAHLSRYKERSGAWRIAGSFGSMAIFSFYPGKNLGAFGDAGAIVTDDIELANKAKMFANHGRLSKFKHEFEGFNSRMDSIQAAVLNVKINYLSRWNENRKKVALKYLDCLKDVTQIKLPEVSENCDPVWHLFVIRAEKRDKLQSFLKANGISTGIHYPVALPNLPAYKYLKHKPEDFPVASSLAKQILSLPLFPEMTNQQIEFVCSNIKKFYTQK